MNDSISILEQLVTAIEQAGVNVAPTYQEYMPLAFAIANIAEQSIENKVVDVDVVDKEN